jgi:hypothetical protein
VTTGWKVTPVAGRLLGALFPSGGGVTTSWKVTTAEVESFVSLGRRVARPCNLTALLSRQRGAVFANGGCTRLLICTNSSVSLARDPKGSPEGHQVRRIVASLEGTGSRSPGLLRLRSGLGWMVHGNSSYRATGGLAAFVFGLVRRKSSQLVVRSLTSLLAGRFAGWFGSFHGRIPEFVRQSWTSFVVDHGFSPSIEVLGYRVVASVAARSVPMLFSRCSCRLRRGWKEYDRSFERGVHDACARWGQLRRK